MSYGSSITASLPMFGQVHWSGTLNAVLYAITGTLGQTLTPSGMSITNNLDMQGNVMTAVSASVLVPVADTGLPRSLLFAGTGSLVPGELYLRDGANRPVRMTSSGTLNQAAGGGFSGQYVISGALAAYSSSNGTYYFTQSGSQYLLGNLNAANGQFSAPITGTLNIGSYANLETPSGYGLIESTSPGTMTAIQSGTFTQWIDIAKAQTAVGVTLYTNNGWMLFEGAQIDIPLPFVQGDQLQSLVAYTNGNPVTVSLNGRIPFFFEIFYRTMAFVSGATTTGTLLASGASAMTGTMPYLTNSSSSLYVSVLYGATASTVVYNLQATWLRKLI